LCPKSIVLQLIVTILKIMATAAHPNIADFNEKDMTQSLVAQAPQKELRTGAA
jgi:hypothetical protein